MRLFPISRSVVVDQYSDRDCEASEATESEEDTLAERISALCATSECQPSVSDEENQQVTRPGEKYLYYCKEDNMPHQLRTLLQAAADLLSIERKDLAIVVKEFETRLRQEVKEESARKRKARVQERAATAHASSSQEN